MPFDVEAARREFRRLDEAGGEIRTDRIPTREDIHARWHWRMERMLLKEGFDPAESGVGRKGYLIGGVGKPILRGDLPPLEHRFGYDPMPLDWFGHAGALAVTGKPDPEHRLLNMLCAGHLAGFEGRPSGGEMHRMLTRGTEDAGERQLVRELLADIRTLFYPRLMREDDLCIRDLARAAHECEIRRGALSWWLNRFAMPPGTP